MSILQTSSTLSSLMYESIPSCLSHLSPNVSACYHEKYRIECADPMLMIALRESPRSRKRWAIVFVAATRPYQRQKRCMREAITFSFAIIPRRSSISLLHKATRAKLCGSQNCIILWQRSVLRSDRSMPVRSTILQGRVWLFYFVAAQKKVPIGTDPASSDFF